VITETVFSIVRTKSSKYIAGLSVVSIAGLMFAFATAATVAFPQPAAAQFYSPFGGYQQQRYRPNNYVVKKKKLRRVARRSPRSSRRRTSSQIKREPVGDVMMLISLRRQRIQVYDKQGLVAQAPISSGRSGYRTPTGIFSILQKNKHHRSNLYNDAPMPNMQRLTWSGIALHAGALPGYPASHGCIRLPYSFSRWLFDKTEMHGRIIVSQDVLATPQNLRHDKLFRGLPEAYSDGYTQDAELAPSGNVTLAAAEARGDIVTDAKPHLAVGERQARSTMPISADEEARIARLKALREREVAKRIEVDAQLKEAQKVFDTALIKSDLTAEQLKDAIDALKEGKAELASRQKYAKQIAKDAAKAHKKLKDFDKKYSGASLNQRADALFKLAQLEEALDQRALSLSDEVSAANHAVENQERRLAGLESSIALAKAFDRESKSTLKSKQAQLDLAKKADAIQTRREKHRAKPVSVFISGKTKRLYVRQALQPLFDVPVQIENPRKPLGTHLFTAIESDDGNASFAWNVVAMQSRPGKYVSERSRQSSKSRKKRRAEQQAQTDGRAELLATSALERIDIPQDARDRIEYLMRPGSSLIISDHPISNETGPYTDFVILTR
jgi:lipoprotein-anchoring transpeptidase ErfK/SrfK